MLPLLRDDFLLLGETVSCLESHRENLNKALAKWRFYVFFTFLGLVIGLLASLIDITISFNLIAVLGYAIGAAGFLLAFFDR